MNFRIGTRLWSGLLVLLVLFWTFSLFAVKQYPGLPTPPQLTLWGLPALRYTRDVASMLTIGSLLVGALLIAPHSSRVLRWAQGWIAIWLVSLLALTIFTLSDLEAISPITALQPSTWWAFLTQTSIGRVFTFQLIVTLVLLFLLAALTRRYSRTLAWISLVLGLAACAAPAFLGHGGFSNEHIAMTVSLGIHIAAVSLWVGGLATCIAALAFDRSLARSLMPAFSLLALWCVVVLAETGLLNASLRVGSATSFVGSTYGSLILVKATLLGWLIYLGWQQRSKILPRLQESTPATLALVKYAGIEFFLMATAIAVSITLSRLGFDATSSTSGSFTPIAILVLALGAPLLLQLARQKSNAQEQPSFIRRYPEVASVVLVVAIIEICGIGLASTILGTQLGVIVGSIVLFAAGWLWSIAIDGPRRQTGVIMMMVGFPLSLLLTDAIAKSSTDWRILGVAILVAEIMLISLIAKNKQQVNQDSTSSEPMHV